MMPGEDSKTDTFTVIFTDGMIKHYEKKCKTFLKDMLLIHEPGGKIVDRIHSSKIQEIKHS